MELAIGNRNVKVKQSGSNQNIGERDSLGRRYRTGEAEESDVHLRMERGAGEGIIRKVWRNQNVKE